jgi:hypothetical protein
MFYTEVYRARAHSARSTCRRVRREETIMGHDRGFEESLDVLVERVLDARRAVAALQAEEARILAAALDLALSRMDARSSRAGSDLPVREVSAELAAAMRLSDRTVQGRLGDAATLVERFAATLAAWERGVIDAGHVSAILDTGVLIVDDDRRARFEEVVLAAAQVESPARLRATAKAVAAAIDPEAVGDALRAAPARRGVRLSDLGDGLTRLIADVPAVLGHAILDRLTQQARAVRDGAGDDAAPGAGEAPDRTVSRTATAQGSADADDLPGTAECDGATPTTFDGHRLAREADCTTGAALAADALAGDGESVDADTRTIDQLRADILCDVLLSGAPVAHGDGLGAIAGHVQVTIPATSLVGTDDRPGLLGGYGPVDAETARRLAATTPGCDRLFTDPFTGAVLAVDRYRWNRDLERFLRARDEHCRFPGCRRTARRCDVDHTIDAAWGGPTRDANLAHLCRRHHTLKHASAWAVKQRPGGVLEWRSPTCRTYLDRPPSVVRFVPDAPTMRKEICEPPGDRLSGDPPPF